MVLIRSSKQILAKARRDYPNKPFRLLTDWGEVLILPPTFADEIRNEPKLSFSKAAVQVRAVLSRSMIYNFFRSSNLTSRTTTGIYLVLKPLASLAAQTSLFRL